MQTAFKPACERVFLFQPMTQEQLDSLLAAINTLADAMADQALAIGMLARAVAEQTDDEQSGFDSLDG